MADVLWMSQAEYARHRGVSKQAVSQIKHKLVFDETGKKVDVAASDRALGETRERVGVGRDDDDTADEGPAAGTGAYAPPSDTGGLTKAKTVTEVYRARIAQLEYDERIGKLLLRDDVERSIGVCAEAVTRVIEMWPTRADELAAAFRQGEVAGLRVALGKMSREVLAALSAEMKKLFAPPPPAADVAMAPPPS